MPHTNRPTPVLLDPDVHAALNARAAETHQSLSEVVNQALRQALAEDLEDFAAIRERADEPRIPLAEVVADMKARGRL